MLRFIQRYFAVLCSLLLIMGAYRLVVVPAIEPPPRAPSPLPELSGTLGGEQWWHGLFPAGAWQTLNPKIVQSKSSGAILLSDTFEQVGPKTLKLQPLTMILPQMGDVDSAMRSGGPPPRDVWIVSAEQGATIHFEKPFDLTSGLIPSVERGQLRGAIHITRQIPGHPEERPLSVRTSEVSIERNRVFTQQDVIVEWDAGVIQGHDMKLMLQGDLLNSNGAESSPWGPLRTLELYRVDKIQMTLPDGGLWSTTHAGSRPEDPDFGSLPAHLDVSCGGRFTFDFTRSRGMLNNGVRMVHQLGDLTPDEFLSQEVVFDIEPPARNPLATAAAASPADRIQLKQLEATGIDSLENLVGERKVEIKAPTLGAFASAKRLKVNVLQQRIELDGKLSHAGATQSTAWLQYAGHELTAPRIDYDADGDGRAASPEHLGYLIAQGAGELRMPASSSMGSASVRWQSSLEMRPTETPGLQWIGLFGNVLVESAVHGFLTSDMLEVWLRKSAAVSPASNAVLSPAQPLNSATTMDQYQPERLHANGQIRLETEQIKVRVSDMNVTTNFIKTGAPSTAPSEPQLALMDSAGRSMHQWVQPPAASIASDQAVLPQAEFGTLPTSSVGPSLQDKRRINPITVTGRSMTSTLIVADDQSWVDNLTIVGPLEVVGDAPRPGMAAWHLEGDELQLETNPAGQLDMQVAGRPARVSLAEGALEGPIIRFNQEYNLVWMDQPGEFTIPTSGLAKSGSPQSLNWINPPHCKWQGHLLFDGQAVRIDGDVRFDGAVRTEQGDLWWVNGYSQALQLDLSHAIDMDHPSTGDVHPSRVTVSNDVNIFASQLDGNGNKKSLEQIQLPSLTFDMQTNELTGLGPGSIRSRHVAQAGLGRLTGDAPGTPPVQTLQGAHLVFRDSMRGFLQRKELYFQGKVELAVGPLISWEDTIDLATMQELSLDQLLLSCDLLKLYDTSGLSSMSGLAAQGQEGKTWEFQARGNVNFEGQAESGAYEGNGSEVTYVQATELLTLLGEPRRSAVFRRIPHDPRAESAFELSVEHIAIHPKTLGVESYKLGQNGARMEMPSGSPATMGQPVTTIPAGNNAPNPRGSVSDFFQRQVP